MIEGQEGVTWEDWVALADTCERVGIEALFRSDHYVSVMGPHGYGRSSLDAWGTINALAARTSTLLFGTMVSPASFRHPSVLAKLVTTADHISGGRVELGMGTGWSQVEHDAYGFPFHAIGRRMDVLEEQLAIVHDGHWGAQPFSFDGDHYVLKELDAQPKPLQRPHPPLIVGGSAGPRSARLAARYADEYNFVMPALAQIPAWRASIEAACDLVGRAPIPLSVMTSLIVGGDEVDLGRRAAAVSEVRGAPIDLEAMADTWIAGTTEQVIERLRRYEQAGIQRIYLQHLPHRDLETVELIGRELVPALRG